LIQPKLDLNCRHLLIHSAMVFHGLSGEKYVGSSFQRCHYHKIPQTLFEVVERGRTSASDTIKSSSKPSYNMVDVVHVDMDGHAWVCVASYTCRPAGTCSKTQPRLEKQIGTDRDIA
jgi:hypothetical protein